MKNLFLSTLFLFGCWQASAQDYLQIAKTCFENGDYQTAKKNYEVYQIFEGKDMSAEIQKADECFKALIMANDYFNNKKYEEARERYKFILEKNPKDPYAKKQYEICEEILSIRQSTAQPQIETVVKDIITLRNGEDIQALVQEVGDVDVRYKRFDNPNGPSFTLKKSEIFSIQYANGSKDVFPNSAPSVSTPTIQRTPPQDGEIYRKGSSIRYSSNGQKVRRVDDLFYDVPEALRAYNSGQTWRVVGGCFSGGGIGLMVSSTITLLINLDEYEEKPDTTLLWVGAGMSIVGIIFSSIGGSKIQSAINMYNSSIRRQQTSNLSMNFGLTQSGGVGLMLNF